MDVEALRELERTHVWRPYTAAEDHASRLDPCIVSAEGPYLHTADGRRLFDGSGSWWCNNLGHRHPRIVSALREQCETMMHVPGAGMWHEQSALLAKALVDAAPQGISRVFYSDNGSTAVEVAMKMALQFFQQIGQPQKQRFAALPGGYHGDTFATMAAGDMPAFHGKFDVGPLRAMTSALDPNEVGWERVFSDLCAMIEECARDLAGVVIEPCVQGAAGMRMHPPHLLKELESVCRQSDVLLIADEVFVGLGRTGKMWASEHAGIRPDLIASAKGLSAGALPFSATLATERIYDGFRGGKANALMHGHTFFANPLGARVAREVLAIYEDDSILARASASATRLSEVWHAAAADCASAVNARTFGMVAAVDIGKDNYIAAAGWHVQRAAETRGLHLRPLGNTLYLIPPLNVEHDAMQTAINALFESIDECASAKS